MTSRRDVISIGHWDEKVAVLLSAYYSIIKERNNNYIQTSVNHSVNCVTC